MGKERPILFSAPMVRATLAGTKTQTRRVVKPAKHPDFGNLYDPGMLAAEPQHVIVRACPYGQPGDRLWVREAWAYHPDFPESARRALHRADRGVEHDVERWRPSIHMPRWASRITLEITRVRVERLQDIGEADAVAEGVAPQPTCRPDDDTAAFSRIGRVHGDSFPIARYAALWEHINGPGSWAANPWVWVVEFARTQEGASHG